MTTWRSGNDYAFLGDGVLVVWIQDIGRMIRMRPEAQGAGEPEHNPLTRDPFGVVEEPEDD